MPAAVLWNTTTPSGAFTATYGGVISGNGSFTKGGGLALALTGANTYTGTTYHTSGTLRLGNGTSGNDGTLASTSIVISGGTLEYNRFGSLTYSGDISGAGNVNKTGAGTQTLSGNNSYTGTTTVTTGTLAITGTLSSSARLDPRGTGILDLTAVAPYTVGTGRTLTGTGIVTGAVTVSGILSPGIIAGTNTPGTLTTDALTLTSATAVNMDISSNALISDRVKANGAVDLGSSTLTVTDVAVAPATLAPGSKLVLVDYTGQSLTGTFAGLAEGATVTVGTNSFIISYVDTTDGVNTGNFVTLSIPISDPYAAWAASKGLTPPDADKADDKENDGIDNVLEWVLGGDPLVSDTSILPTSTQSGSNLTFSFNRADSTLGAVALTLQYGDDLTGWTDVTVPAASLGIFTVTDNGATDLVVATIPVGAAPVKFARLKAE